MHENNIAVSVVCLAYNHEKYIAQALDGFLAQKTSFAYEVVVHDDASTDRTQEIIRDYASRYPDIIKPILQSENQFSKKVKIHKTFTVPQVKGKYVALCEGDDFWNDSLKLQKQFDILEASEDCTMCVHYVQEVYEDGSVAPKGRPSIPMEEGKIGIQDFLNIQRKYPFQTSSFFMRSDLWKQFNIDPPEFRKVADVGDEPMLLYMVAHGSLYYLPTRMSSYRIMSQGSWSEKQRRNPQQRIRHFQCMYNMMCAFDEYTNHEYECYLLKAKCTMLRYEGKYKEILKKENRAYLKDLSFPKRLYICLCAIFPFVSKIIKAD